MKYGTAHPVSNREADAIHPLLRVISIPPPLQVDFLLRRVPNNWKRYAGANFFLAIVSNLAATTDASEALHNPGQRPPGGRHGHWLHPFIKNIW